MNFGHPVAILRQKFQQSIGLPFAEILPQSQIESALLEVGVSYRKHLFCPIRPIVTKGHGSLRY